MQQELVILLIGALILLIIASVIGFILSKKAKSPEQQSTISNLNARTRSWWVMVAVFAITLYLGYAVTVLLFLALSFFALREFITLNTTRRSDHRVLFWTFFVITPLQYLLVGIQWYGLFSIFIPVYAFTFIPIRKALAGDTTDFLSSTAKIQWGLLVCVYFISHIPLIMTIPVQGHEGNNSALLFFFVFTVQASDVLQYVWGKMFGKKAICPTLSPHKTWAGFLGGIGSTCLLSSLLWWATPFSPWQAGLMALLVCLAGFAGGLVMSAIKRDLGAKDWGNAIAGHGGFMDRLDSLCFAAPLFFHLTGFFFGHGIDPKPPAFILNLL